MIGRLWLNKCQICHWRASSLLFMPNGCDVLDLFIRWASRTFLTESSYHPRGAAGKMKDTGNEVVEYLLCTIVAGECLSNVTVICTLWLLFPWYFLPSRINFKILKYNLPFKFKIMLDTKQFVRDLMFPTKWWRRFVVQRKK